MKRCVLALMLAAGMVSACSGDDATQIASGPVATTPPLALPIELKSSVPQTAGDIPTTAPLTSATEPEPEPVGATPTPESTPPGATPLPLPTTAPTAVPDPTTAPDPTAAPAQAPEPTSAATPEPAGSVTPTPFPPSEDGPRIPLVDIDVVNVFNGEIEPLVSMSPAGATLIYFWTPSCPQCLIDGPSIGEFARTNPDVEVVALGAGAKPRDTVELARLFPERTGVTNTANMTMTYDTSYRSWQQFGVVSQPHWILYDSTGNPVLSQPGAIDLDIVASVLTR